jgi:MFS family permease
VLRPYRSVLALPGALAFSAAGFVARLPIAMMGLGIVLLLSAVSGSYALAGAVAGTFSLLAALIGPQLARLVDRLGQARVLVPLIAVHACAMVALMVAAVSDAPRWVLFGCAALAGGSMPNIGSLVRARWSHLVGGTGGLHTAYSFEAVIDEMIFILGPVLVTVLATQVHRLAGLSAVVVVTVVGGLWLAAQRGTEPPPSRATGRAGGSAIRVPGVVVITAVFGALGSLFGSFEVTVVGFTSAEGQRGAAGLVLATYALGSLIAGVGYGAVRWRARLDRRFLVGVTAMGLSLLPLPFVGGVAPLVGLAFVAGFAISPTLIAAMSLVESLVPASRLTEGLAWTITGIGLGLTVGSAVSGWAIDAMGAERAFWVTTLSALAAVGLAFSGARFLRVESQRELDLMPSPPLRAGAEH